MGPYPPRIWLDSGSTCFFCQACFVTQSKFFALHVWHIVLTHEVLSDSLDLQKLEGKGVKDSPFSAETMAQAPALWACKLPWPPIGWRLSKFIVASAISGKVPADWSRVNTVIGNLVCGLGLKERLGVGGVFWQRWPISLNVTAGTIPTGLRILRSVLSG